MTKREKVFAWVGGITAGALAFFGIAHYAAAAPSSGSGGGTGKTVTVTITNSGQTINLNVGDTVSISLPVDTTGQQKWAAMPGSGVSSTGTPIFQILSDNVVQAAGGAFEQLVMKATGKGSTMIGLNLVNTNNPTAPLASFKVNLVVS